MKSALLPTLLLTLVLILAACAAPAAQPAAPQAPEAAPDTQTTPAAIIAALPPTPDLLPTATPAQPVDTAALSQEELEARINQAVNEAVAATAQASTAAMQAASDAAVTGDELHSLHVYAAAAEQAVTYAEQLLALYRQEYGDLAIEALETAGVMASELEQMSQSITALNAGLAAIDAALQQGQALPQETIQQLERAALVAGQTLLDVTSHAAAFMQQAQISRDNRVREISALQPDAIPADLQSTLAGAFSFIDQVRSALGDNKLDRAELGRLAQLSANLTAGFQAHGAGQFAGLSASLSAITQQLARGQAPLVRRGLDDFERVLPGSRP